MYLNRIFQDIACYIYKNVAFHPPTHTQNIVILQIYRYT